MKPFDISFCVDFGLSFFFLLHLSLRLFLYKTIPTTMMIMMTIEPITVKYISAESLLFSRVWMVSFPGIIKRVDVTRGSDVDLALLMRSGRFEIRRILCPLAGFSCMLFDLARSEVESKTVLGVDVLKIGATHDKYVDDSFDEYTDGHSGHGLL